MCVTALLGALVFAVISASDEGAVLVTGCDTWCEGICDSAVTDVGMTGVTSSGAVTCCTGSSGGSIICCGTRGSGTVFDTCGVTGCDTAGFGTRDGVDCSAGI